MSRPSVPFLTLWRWGSVVLAGLGLCLMLLAFDGDPRTFVGAFLLATLGAFAAILGGLATIVVRVRQTAARIDRAARGGPATIDPAERLPPGPG